MNNNIDITSIMAVIEEEALKVSKNKLGVSLQDRKSKPIKLVSNKARWKHYLKKFYKSKNWIYKVPLFGYLFRTIIFFLHLPNKIAQLNGLFENVYNGKFQQHEKQINEMTVVTRNLKSELNFLTKKNQEYHKEKVKIICNLPEFTSYIKNFDDFYAKFEEVFRAPEEVVSKHLEQYIPYLKRSPLNLSSYTCVDIGCGRGEWLKLLKKEGVNAKGIEINSYFIKRLQESKLEVINSDVLDYLNSTPHSTHGLISMFHLVEHISPEMLIIVLDRAFRALCSKGMLIIETPNPENLHVASCNFYTDLTHKHPIPPLALDKYLRIIGFCDIVLIKSNPIISDLKASTPVEEKFLNWCHGEQDYAYIAYKP